MSYRARHRRPSRAPQLAFTSLSTAVVLGEVISVGGAYAATDDDWARIRRCESGGNYAINTGNGYYGAYQFDLRTWHGLGYAGLPSDAPPAVQDAAARKLYAQRGWQPWGCARKLGLYGGGPGRPARASRSHARFTRVRHSKAIDTVVVQLLPKGTVLTPPDAPAVAFTRKMADTYSAQVKAWQVQMAARGWTITVDGYFGSESAAVAAAFEADKGLLPTTRKGTVDTVIWNATWAEAVT